MGCAAVMPGTTGVLVRWIGFSQSFDDGGDKGESLWPRHDPSTWNLSAVNPSHPPVPVKHPTSAKLAASPANDHLDRSPLDSTDVDATGADVCSDYLLVCQATSEHLNQGSWHFTLESADGDLVLEATDDEIGDLNRLTLLATVRGLEAIEGPSRVTLLSTNRYLIRSLSDSLPRWRENNFVWEHFGRRIDVQHADLWRRVDRALSIHRVEACLVSSRLVSAPKATVPSNATHRTIPSGAGGSPADGLQIRIDSAHDATPPRPASVSPKDQLRRWLLGTAAQADAGTIRRRFTAADLVEN